MLIRLSIIVLLLFTQLNAQEFGVSIINYGAKPANNWESASDNSEAIQKAIDSNPGRTILIPSGIYLLKKEINLSHEIKLMGESKYSTVL